MKSGYFESLLYKYLKLWMSLMIKLMASFDYLCLCTVSVAACVAHSDVMNRTETRPWLPRAHGQCHPAPVIIIASMMSSCINDKHTNKRQ